MSKIIVSPSLLSADFANLERDIKLLEMSGADWLHVDVMDGLFVPNISVGIPVVQSIRKITKLCLDVHLMIQNPQNYIEQFVKAGADILTFHYEAVKQPRDVIDLIKSYNIKAGISIKPDTLPEKILEFLPDLDLVLIMTVEPGFGGQSFINYCADKIKVIKKHAHEGLFIQVDGGINDVTAKICTDLGANSLVAGNYIFKSNDFRSAIKLLRQGS